MQLRKSSDWAAAMALAFAGAAHALFGYGYGDAISRIVAVVFAVLVVIFVAAAIRGQRLPDGALVYTWADLGLDGTAIFFSAGLLFFASSFIARIASQPPGIAVFGVALGIGFLWFAWSFVMQRQTVAISKTFIFRAAGRPMIFWQKTWQTSEFTQLEVMFDRAYAGTLGMVTTWRRAWYIQAVGRGKRITVIRCDDREDCLKTMDELAELTGLRKGEVPNPGGSDETRAISG